MVISAERHRNAESACRGLVRHSAGVSRTKAEGLAKTEGAVAFRVLAPAGVDA